MTLLDILKQKISTQTEFPIIWESDTWYEGYLDSSEELGK
jgi:hypothetical protein